MTADALRAARRGALRKAAALLEGQAKVEREKARTWYLRQRAQATTVEEAMALTLNDDVAVAFERAADLVRGMVKEQ